LGIAVRTAVGLKRRFMTVGDILVRNANKWPKKTALVWEGNACAYGTLNSRVNRLANALMKKGLKKGDRLGVLAHNGPRFVELYFAAAKTGAIFCPYNNHLVESEAIDIIGYSEPRFIFFDADYDETIRSARQKLSFIEDGVCLESSGIEGTESYEDVLRNGDDREPGVNIGQEDPVSMLFTAGTTGRPKGAVHTHNHVLVNAINGVIELEVAYDENILLTVPMYHVAGEDNITRHMFIPNTIFIRREGGFNGADVLSFIEEHRITRCQMVPTMVHTLLQTPDISRFDLSSLKQIIYTGSPMPVELLRQALERFPCGFAQMYGQTEAGPLIALLRAEDHILDGSEEQVRRLASTGRPVLNCEVRITNEEGEDMPAGEIGEIAVRSEAMMRGYYRMPEETSRKLRNGWLYTGDVGRLDADGYLYIAERKNDLIISGGVNIYPREIEEVLYRLDAVSETAVVGEPDEHWGEKVKAVIVLKEGKTITDREVIDFCGKHLSAYKKPKSVEFWDELPKSSQGKVLKKTIREMLKSRAA
jgi:acyl-CoA synthetase (AMP-forming)/AMP-acid ligase II